jgi:hypothetical protein
MQWQSRNFVSSFTMDPMCIGIDTGSTFTDFVSIVDSLDRKPKGALYSKRSGTTNLDGSRQHRHLRQVRR